MSRYARAMRDVGRGALFAVMASAPMGADCSRLYSSVDVSGGRAFVLDRDPGTYLTFGADGVTTSNASVACSLPQAVPWERGIDGEPVTSMGDRYRWDGWSAKAASRALSIEASRRSGEIRAALLADALERRRSR